MRKTTINFAVELDDNNLPDKITWDATDKPENTLSQTRSLSLALWDHQQKNTLRIDLWTKDMTVDEMKRFYVDCIGGLSQSALTATGDEAFSSEMSKLCERLIELIKKEQGTE